VHARRVSCTRISWTRDQGPSEAYRFSFDRRLCVRDGGPVGGEDGEVAPEADEDGPVEASIEVGDFGAEGEALPVTLHSTR